MYLPQRAEDRFFEATTCAGEIRSALSAGRDELAGDDPRQLANLENAKGGVVVEHSSGQKHDAPERSSRHASRNMDHGWFEHVTVRGRGL